jgi:hypothetical protein
VIKVAIDTDKVSVGVLYSNSKSKSRTEEEEQAERQKAVEETLKYFRSFLPMILRVLAKIKDPRQPGKVQYKQAVLFIYGLLMFVFQVSSRREANRIFTKPMFIKNIKEMFPELADLPHADTLEYFLELIGDDVNYIEKALVENIIALIKNKKFQAYLVNNQYLIAIDGTKKLSRNYRFAKECQERHHKREGGGEEIEYYAYVLEANLVFPNGFTLPLLSEFLDRDYGDAIRNKQDCELNAFKRLAVRIKGYFPRLSIMLLLDGLYAVGTVMEICRKYDWDFMIVLKDNCLPSVWAEVNGLSQLKENKQNHFERKWGNRQQKFYWVNDIEYYWNNDKKVETIHVVICEETWEEIDRDGKVIQKHSRHAWISAKPLAKNNIHYRCNQAARHRWSIENCILVEKHYGYSYEHGFALDWNAMRGYHYLMRLGHLINQLASKSIYIVDMVRSKGNRAFILFVRETVTAPWLNLESIRTIVAKGNYQIRMDLG